MADRATNASNGGRSASAVGAAFAGAALVIMLGNVLSRLLGLAREQVAAGLFGTGDPIAAFTVADNVQTLLFDLMVSGMLEAALIPVLARWAAPDPASRAQLRRVAGALLTLVLLVAGGVALVGLVGAPWIARGMTALGGEAQSRGSGTFALTVTLVRWLLVAVVLLSLGTVLMAVLYALGRVTAPALAAAARNAAIVGTALLLAGPLGVRSLAVGAVVGAGLICLLQASALVRADALPRPNLGFGQPAVREVLRLYGPIFAGLLVSTAAVVVDRNLAWGAGEDALGAMRYATTLAQTLLGLVAAAISLAALPGLSRLHAAGDAAGYRQTLARALLLVTALIVPATLGLAALAEPAVALLFQHGATGPAQARQIEIALLGYLPGTLCAAFDQVLVFAFYARHDTRTPVLVGVAAVGVYFAVALALVRPLGMLGLVLGNSAQWAAHAGLIWWLTRRRIGRLLQPGEQRVARRCVVAAAGAALVALVAWLALGAMLPAGSGGQELARRATLAAGPAGLGGALYLLALRRAGVEELDALARAATRRLRPRPA